MKIVPDNAVPANAMIVIRGLPRGMRFSEGRPFGPGVWVIPVGRLDQLEAQAAPDTVGGDILTLALTSLEGRTIAETRMLVISAPVAASRDTKETTGFIGNGASPPAPAPLPSLAAPRVLDQRRSEPPDASPSKGELLTLLQKGRENLSLGNILLARQFFERAANKGLAEAAMALAATYDARELTLLGTRGITPDAERARKWYEKARELGSPEAAARLSELSPR